MKNRTALVCGAGGFIGGHLVKELKEEGLLKEGKSMFLEKGTLPQ